MIADDHAEIGPETCELTTPSGVITVSDGEASVNRFELPAPGTYHVRVTGHGMDAAELYRAAESGSTDFEDAQFQADWALLQGRETYIVRLWPAT
ncbi:hypothetical protein D0T12_02600 [Actinomadura spongiicola]|uniref:Uncharacterized protein n=1 Tax=Actinomadura spongiicola TaxID=2303421 RepID=A0A372GPA7_9ACTN|nr:hypothetical protein D0T12_02600 [Actinomadura spongiicola]